MDTPKQASVRLTARFRPSLIDALQGYTSERLMRDIIAGATVGVVALPLAMAFAMASGLKPEAGIFTAVLAGFLISALGGSRVQIGGPAGAFIVIVYGIVERYGVANLIIATALSGVMLFLMGLFKLGTLIRFIPVAVVIGFTNGIAVLIALSQVKDFLGLSISNMPANFFGMLSALYANLHTLNPQSLALAIAALTLVVGWQWLSPRMSAKVVSASKLSAVPGSIVALIVTTLAVWLLDLQVDTIGSRFGGIPSSLPGITWPALSWESARFMLVPASTLAMLGAIESLLCARVADGLTGDRHDPNQELMAQGVANFVTPFFGGMPATGTIARTMTNIKSGAASPIAGMVHAATLLLIMLVAAPLATHVPLATLAAILMFVAWNMGEWREFAHLRQYRMPYRITLLAVFFLTVVFDLTVAVEVGLIAACITFIYRISSLSRSVAVTASEMPALAAASGTVQAYRLHGALFFGAVKLLEEIEDQLPQQALVLDFANVIYMDSSGVDALTDLLRASRKGGVRLLISSLEHQPQDIARRSGLLAMLNAEDLQPDLQQAVESALQAPR
ncbi:MAG: C4-dicarboxylic acid transporter DauA [Pseudomonadota bacterium]